MITTVTTEVESNLRRPSFFLSLQILTFVMKIQPNALNSTWVILNEAKGQKW